MTTTHNGFVLRQLILESRICELKLALEEASDEQSITDVQTRLQAAALEAGEGRARLTDDEFSNVLDTLRAMSDSAHEEAKQLAAMADKKRPRMTVVETPPEDAA